MILKTGLIQEQDIRVLSAQSEEIIDHIVCLLLKIGLKEIFSAGEIEEELKNYFFGRLDKVFSPFTHPLEDLRNKEQSIYLVAKLSLDLITLERLKNAFRKRILEQIPPFYLEYPEINRIYT